MISENELGNMELQYIEFTLANQKFCLPIDDVEEILRKQAVLPVPKAHPFLLGVTSIRGEVYPVIDAAKLFGQEGKDSEEKRFILLSKTYGNMVLSVDQVQQIFTAGEKEDVEDKPYVSTGIKSGEELYYLLDVQGLYEELKKASME